MLAIRHTAMTLALLLAATTGVVIGGQSTASAATCAAAPVIAHRGLGGDTADQPEDTSQAELEAAGEGANYLNVDVQWTSDLDPVAIHDTTLDRTTTGSGLVSSITSTQFIHLQSRYNAPTGEIGAVDTTPGMHPQTLYELLAAVKSTGRPVLIQMESDPLQTAGLSQSEADTEIQAVLDRIVTAGMTSKVVIAGWAGDDLIQFDTDAHAEGYSIPAAILEDPNNPTAASVQADGASILDIDYESVTATRVAAWHAGGLTVWAWTPGTWSDFTWMHNDHVDAVTTNWVSSYESWAAYYYGCHS